MNEKVARLRLGKINGHANTFFVCLPASESIKLNLCLNILRETPTHGLTTIEFTINTPKPILIRTTLNEDSFSLTSVGSFLHRILTSLKREKVLT